MFPDEDNPLPSLAETRPGSRSSADEPSFQPPTRFRSLESIGSGGMGRVFKGWDRTLQRTVAVKFLSDELAWTAEARWQLYREARALSRLDHPNICTVHEIAEDAQGRPYIVMAYYEGETMRARLERGPMPLPEALEAIFQVCLGLQAAHEARIIHRDVKPANIMLTSDGSVRLLDFGVARMDEGAATISGLQIGTPRYMSPEQLRGERVDERTDIWSVGTVLLEAVLGRAALDATVNRLVTSPGQAFVPPIRVGAPTVRRTLIALIQRCLGPSREQRYASTRLLLADLRGLLARLGSLGTFEPEGEEDRPPVSAEHRPLTVLHCGLPRQGTALETLYRSAVVLERLCGELAARVGGQVTLDPKNDVILTFGYPSVQEHGAQQAIDIALELHQRLRGLDDLPVGPVRIGVHSGLALVRADLPRRADGGAPIVSAAYHVAESLSREAAPGRTRISASTRNHVGGRFVLEETDAVEVDGEPIPTFEVLDRTSSSDAAGRPIGRDEEVSILLKLWSRIEAGDGRSAVVVGEPGIGKSYLVTALSRRIRSKPHARVMTLHCSSYLRDGPLHPVLELLDSTLLAEHGGPDASTLERLLALSEHLYGSAHPGAWALASLLGIHAEEPEEVQQMTPERRRTHLFDFVQDVLLPPQEDRPTLMILEDVHWIDDGTADLLARLGETTRRRPLFLVVTQRPDTDTGASQLVDATVLNLQRLLPDEARELLESVVEIEELDPEVVSKLLSLSEGVPLFIEELGRVVSASPALLKGPSEAPPAVVIPGSLAESLAARLDAAGLGKPVAQVASVIGRSFRKALLERVWDGESGLLDLGLDALQQERLLRGDDPEGSYVFKHILVQEAAYSSLADEERRRYHLRVAEVLRRDAREVRSAVDAERVAQHLLQGGAPLEAGRYFLEAATVSIRQGSNAATISYSERGLEALSSLPATPETRGLRLGLLVALGPAVMATEGYASPRVASTYREALDISRALADGASTFAVTFGLWTFHCVRGEHEAAERLAEDLLAMAAAAERPDLHVEAAMAAGITQYFEGHFEDAARLLDSGLEHYEYDRDKDQLFVFGQDPAMVLLSYKSWNQWMLGFTEEAIATSAEAVTHARRFEHPHTLAYALTFAAWLDLSRGDPAAAAAPIAEALEVCEENRLGIFLALSRVLEAWRNLAVDPSNEALLALETVVEQFEGAGGRLFVPYWLGLIASAHLSLGRPEKAAATIEAAVLRSEASQERWCLAELLRMESGVRAAEPEGQPDASLARAREVAETQGAAAWLDRLEA